MDIFQIEVTKKPQDFASKASTMMSEASKLPTDAKSWVDLNFHSLLQISSHLDALYN